MINSLPLPSRLRRMIESGEWKHPGGDVLKRAVPFIDDPLIFLHTKEDMIFNSGALMGATESKAEVFSEYRGSQEAFMDLPWIDVELRLYIICNKIPGDDCGIALDYRTGLNTPRVVATDWLTREGCIYKEVSKSFDDFLDLIGL